jgi:hypothetical protein
MKILFIFSLALGLSSQEFLRHKINTFKNSYFTQSEGIDEEVCDEQFMKFYQAYLTQEIWALTCKQLQFGSLKILIFSPSQFMTRGQKYQTEYLLGIQSTLVIMRNV